MSDASDNVFNVEAFITEMTAESDRGCILVGASLLDSLLGDMLKLYLAGDAHSTKHACSPLFEGMGPLSSFSARIKLAYCLGLLTRPEFEDLERIRKIRNRAAHEFTAKSFEQDEIIQIVRHLAGADRFPPATTLLAADAIHVGEKDDEARRFGREKVRFLFTVAYLSGVIRGKGDRGAVGLAAISLVTKAPALRAALHDEGNASAHLPPPKNDEAQP